MGQVSLNPGLQPKRRIDAPAHQVHLPHAACFHTEQLCKPAPIVRGAGIATLYRSAKRRLAFELCWQPGGSAAQASEAAAARATAEELQRCREALAELAGPALPSTPRDCGAPPALALLNTSARPLPHTALCHSCLRDSGALRPLQDRRPRPRPILPNYFPIPPQRALAPPGAALYARAVLADAGEGGGAEAPPRPLTPRERSLLETCAPDMRPPQQSVGQGRVRVLIPACSAKAAVEQQLLAGGSALRVVCALWVPATTCHMAYGPYGSTASGICSASGHLGNYSPSASAGMQRSGMRRWRCGARSWRRRPAVARARRPSATGARCCSSRSARSCTGCVPSGSSLCTCESFKPWCCGGRPFVIIDTSEALQPGRHGVKA